MRDDTHLDVVNLDQFYDFISSLVQSLGILSLSPPSRALTERISWISYPRNALLGQSLSPSAQIDPTFGHLARRDRVVIHSNSRTLMMEIHPPAVGLYRWRVGLRRNCAVKYFGPSILRAVIYLFSYISKDVEHLGLNIGEKLTLAILPRSPSTISKNPESHIVGKP